MVTNYTEKKNKTIYTNFRYAMGERRNKSREMLIELAMKEKDVRKLLKNKPEEVIQDEEIQRYIIFTKLVIAVEFWRKKQASTRSSNLQPSKASKK